MHRETKTGTEGQRQGEVQGQVTETGNRFETFETDRIHVRVPHSGDLLVVRTESNLSKQVEFM